MLALHDNIAVSIDGKRLHSFKSLKLHQPINDHHRFELLLDLDAASARYVGDFEDGTEWLGKRLLAYKRRRERVRQPRLRVHPRGGRPRAGGFPTWRPQQAVRDGQPVQRQDG